MPKKLAFVLGGGGARGALQVGALRALNEAGYEPDMLVGTSAGAVNAAYLACHGFSAASLDDLQAAWQRAGEVELLPSNYIWLTLRAMLRRASLTPAAHIRNFFIASGITPDLRFAELRGPRLVIVSSDLNSGTPVLHGECADDHVLDALLLSTALPPWSLPVKKQERLLMDGAVVSSLPIEPALRSGATAIIALDLMDARDPFGEAHGFGLLLNKLTYAVEQRHVALELALAQARGVPVSYISLTAEQLVPIWDFGHTGELVSEGYEITREALRQPSTIDL